MSMGPVGILANAVLTFRRKAGGSFVDGEWVGEAEGAPFVVRGSLQPATPKTMQTLPEGRRNRQTFSFWYDVPDTLKTVQSGAANPDVTVIDGDDYEVYSVAVWGDPILPNNHAILQKMEGVPKGPDPEEAP